jgi:hypothetical protein
MHCGSEFIARSSSRIAYISPSRGSITPTISMSGQSPPLTKGLSIRQIAEATANPSRQRVRAAVAIGDAAIRAVAVCQKVRLLEGGRFSRRDRDEHRRPRRTERGDLRGADMAWAKYAAGRAFTIEQIKDELLNSRDLSKKGNYKRQREYAERPARKAIDQLKI